MDEIHIVRDGQHGDKEMNHCPLAYGQHPTLTNDAAPPTMNGVTIARNTAPPSRMSAPRNTLTHQHARSSCGLKDIVNALDLKCRTLLVRARANRLCDSFCLCP
jgi:hypothetical protein